MKSLPIKTRLTGWYFVVLSGALVVFALFASGVMRRSIYGTVDEQLEARAAALQLLISSAGPNADIETLLVDHGELQPGAQLFQISDASGRLLYSSPAMVRLGVPAPSKGDQRIEDTQYEDQPLRILITTASRQSQVLIVQVAEPMDEYLEALDKFRDSVLVGIPLLLVMAAAGGYWLSGRALRPVDQITRAAQSITPQDLSQRLAVPQTGDELQRLTETLNHILERIESAFSRITQFTADASHELRTPTALIRTRAEVTLANPRTNEQYREAMTEVLSESERMSALIENLMLLARADTGTETLDLSDIDVSRLANEVGSQAETLAGTKQIRFELSIPQSPIWVHADCNALRRLLLILVDNAMKYTPERGSVRLTLEPVGTHVEIRVQDTGIGIPDDDLPHVFERFYRSDKARSREVGGTGLGLSIGQWIAQVHGGEIRVESSPTGSLFVVTIPRIGMNVACT